MWKTIVFLAVAAIVAVTWPSEGFAGHHHYRGIGVGIYMQPVSPAVIIPQSLIVQPYAPMTTLRWGFFHRRLVPRTHWVPTSPIIYDLRRPSPPRVVPQPPQALRSSAY